MKLATFEIPTPAGPLCRVGACLDGHIVDLAPAWAAQLESEGSADPEGAARLAAATIPTDMVQFLENGEVGLAAARAALAYVRAGGKRSGGRLTYALTEVKLLAPIPKPPMLRDFMVFETHVKNCRSLLGKDVIREWYEVPVYYKGNIHSIKGPDEDVVWPTHSHVMDYELELAIIIGRRGTNIRPEEAYQYVAGYTILNDFSARDSQKQEMAVGLGPAKGKDFDTGNALGPWLVTADELPDPHNLRMTARVNGNVWSDGHTSTAYWTFAQMIAHASAGETLYPGDILGSGTVGWGCGLEQNRFLQDGDVVELEIEGIGLLRNRVVRRDRANP